MIDDLKQNIREAVPLRLTRLMIACQKAGGRIRLTQEEMATVLDVPRRSSPEPDLPESRTMTRQ
ncbi:hypothetical protein ACFVIZ_20470 [Streptomyces anulatus]|uniref:hypothetical protein n=1 Tax=Streptomyces anulatus TaxID=1892 RepID=UPI00363B18A7